MINHQIWTSRLWILIPQYYPTKVPPDVRCINWVGGSCRWFSSCQYEVAAVQVSNVQQVLIDFN